MNAQREVKLDTDPSILTPREWQVLIALAQGDTNIQVAECYGISVRAVQVHRGNLLKKLKLRNDSDLTRYAIKRGLIDVDGNELPPEAER